MTDSQKSDSAGLVPAERVGQNDGSYEATAHLIGVGNQIARFVDFDSELGKQAIAHNFDGDTSNQLRLASIAMGGGAESGGDHVNSEIEFSYWYCHLVQIVNDKTGEVTECPRTVLIGSEGDAYQFVSHGVFQSLRVILSYLGVGRLETPVTVRIKQRRTRKGWNVLYLEPVLTSS